VLDELSNQVSHMLFVVAGLGSERLERRHLILDFCFVQWHQLVSEHLANKLRNERLSLQLSLILHFDLGQVVNFLLTVSGDKQIKHKVLE
jgi:hypothetical protein